ncbi:MAG: hypothetical protein OQK32_00760, partial [Gammaproteobacteria bacterium]|nr:hypothetical protein [Gammaproteobacteria bacterium]
MKSFGRTVIFFILIFLMATSASWAAPQRGGTCDEGSIGSCMDELLDEQGALILEVEGMVMDMQAMGIFSTDRYRSIMAELATQGYEVPDDPDIRGNMPDDIATRLENLKQDHRRAKETNDTISDDEYDEMLAQGDKEKGKNCKKTDTAFYESLWDDSLGSYTDPAGYTNAVMGNGNNKLGNGKCDLFSALDLDGNAVWVNEKSENMCEEECKVKQNQQGQSKGRMLGSMQESITSARVARQTISMQRAQLAAVGGQVSRLGSLETDYYISTTDKFCSAGDPGFDVDLVLIGVYEVIMIATDAIIIASDILAQITKGIHDTVDKVCKQTLFGANTSTACTPPILIHHIAKTVVHITKAVKTATKHVKFGYEYGHKIYDATQRNKEKDC